MLTGRLCTCCADTAFRAGAACCTERCFAGAIRRSLALDKAILNPRIIVVIDRDDLDKQIKETFRLLAPYSPDFNPIEKALCRLKAMLRKVGERTVSGLWDLIGRPVDIFQPHRCANYFKSCGYEPE